MSHFDPSSRRNRGWGAPMDVAHIAVFVLKRELVFFSGVGSIHLIPGQGQAGIDDLLATEQKRVGLESGVAIVGVLRVDRRFDRPTVFTLLAHQKSVGDRRGVSLFWLGDPLILNRIRILQVL